ncbi:MAG: hypothetical protein WA628_12695 [Terriglobales bacterium]
MLTNRYFALVFFSAALLLCMIREWSAPVACPRGQLNPAVTMSNR